ncbi:MAG: deoxyribose-phosphate aldolase [Ignisphaera sp.]
MCIESFVNRLSVEDMAKLIDNTLLKPEATLKEIVKSIEETRNYGFNCIVLSPYHALQILSNGLSRDVDICSVVGFPMGFTSTSIKVMEAEELLSRGVKEIDMVMNIQAFKSSRYDEVLNDIVAVVDVAKRYGAIAKVIIESPILSYTEKMKAVELVIESGAHFVKTSTGILSKTNLHDVYTIVKLARGRVKVKASGGFRNAVDVLMALAIGANRIGTSSAVQIIEEFKVLKETKAI